MATSSRTSLPNMQEVPADKLQYSVDVYVDDFIPMAIATSKEQQEHVTEAVMHGIHDDSQQILLMRKTPSLTRRS